MELEENLWTGGVWVFMGCVWVGQAKHMRMRTVIFPLACRDET